MWKINRRALPYITLIVFTLMTFAHVGMAQAQTNLLINAGFEQAGSSAQLADKWNQFHSGYQRDATNHSGSWSIKLSNTTISQISGAFQRVDLNQSELKPVFIGGYVKGENIVNSPSGYFGASMYAEIHLQNGRIAYWNSTANLGTFDWKLIGFNTSSVTAVDQPIKYIYVVPILGNAQGTAFFDDVIVEEGGSVCGNGSIEPGEECDDSNTTDGDGCSSTCTIETPPDPFCGDATCDPDEDCTSCSADCGECPPPDPFCGDATCDAGEDCTSCSADCGECPPPDPFCGDATCDAGEDCTSCSADCGECPPPGSNCGDASCDPDEDCTSCSADCGECPPPDPFCGDASCDPDEDCTSCSADCGECPPPDPFCGDASCDPGEDCTSCSADCGECPPSPNPELVNPGFEEQGSSAQEAFGWQPYQSGYQRVITRHSGSWGIKLRNTNGSQISGASQRIDLNQTEIKPVFIGGYVKGSSIVNSGGYFGASIYTEIHLQDGTVKYWNSLANYGSFSWRWIGFNTRSLSLDGVTKFIDQPISHIFVVPILAQATGRAYFDDIQVMEFNPTQSAVTLMIDDGDITTYTEAKPTLDSHGFAGSVSIITDMVGDSGFMTWNQVKQLNNSGWEIVSHGISHSDLTTLSNTQINRELSRSRRILERRVLPVNNFALPYGTYNDYILARGARYYTSVRAYELGDNPQGTYPFEVKVRSVVESTTPEQVAAWVAEAQANNSWVILVFHKIVETGDDVYYSRPDVFSDIVQTVADSGVSVLTYDQGIKTFTVTK